MDRAEEHTDEQLVEAANAGDVAAFEALYRRYRDWVAVVAFRFSRSHEDAMDITQETFVWLLGKFPGFKLNVRMKTVLYPAIKNAAITRLRKQQTTEKHTSFFANQSTDSTSSPSLYEAEERLAGLRHMLDQLPEQQREVLILRFSDDLKIEEIAEVMQIPAGTVKSRLHHALHTLRENEITKKYFSD